MTGKISVTLAKIALIITGSNFVAALVFGLYFIWRAIIYNVWTGIEVGTTLFVVFLVSGVGSILAALTIDDSNREVSYLERVR